MPQTYHVGLVLTVDTDRFRDLYPDHDIETALEAGLADALRKGIARKTRRTITVHEDVTVRPPQRPIGFRLGDQP